MKSGWTLNVRIFGAVGNGHWISPFSRGRGAKGGQQTLEQRGKRRELGQKGGVRYQDRAHRMLKITLRRTLKINYLGRRGGGQHRGKAGVVCGGGR